MSNYFFDTSAICKRYSDEPGSQWVQQIASAYEEHAIFVSELTVVEGVSAFARMSRKGIITSSENSAFQRQFLTHLTDEYLVLLIDRTTIAAAREMINRHSEHFLRALDAIQLASAIALNERLKPFGESFTFVTADVRLTASAVAQGFEVFNPETASAQ